MVALAINVNRGQLAGIERTDPASQTRGEASGCVMTQPRSSPKPRVLHLRHSSQSGSDGVAFRRNSGRCFIVKLLKSVCFFISIMLPTARLPHLAAQQLTNPAPLAATTRDALPEAPGTTRYPYAEPIAAKEERTPVSISSDGPQTIA